MAVSNLRTACSPRRRQCCAVRAAPYSRGRSCAPCVDGAASCAAWRSRSITFTSWRSYAKHLAECARTRSGVLAACVPAEALVLHPLECVLIDQHGHAVLDHDVAVAVLANVGTVLEYPCSASSRRTSRLSSCAAPRRSARRLSTASTAPQRTRRTCDIRRARCPRPRRTSSSTCPFRTRTVCGRCTARARCCSPCPSECSTTAAGCSTRPWSPSGPR